MNSIAAQYCDLHGIDSPGIRGDGWSHLIAVSLTRSWERAKSPEARVDMKGAPAEPSHAPSRKSPERITTMSTLVVVATDQPDKAEEAV